MTEQSNIEAPPNEPVSTARRSRPFLAIGTVLWVVCFAVLAILFIGPRFKSSTNRTSAESTQQDPDDGKVGAQVKIVPSQDGTLSAQVVAPGSDDNPWEPEGIADFSFTDCNNQPVTKQDLLGKPFIIGFVFTNCRGPCPSVTRQMQELQNRLKEFDFNLVTLTVDPERDSVETLRNYGMSYGADFDRWKFLTGDQAEIYGLIQNSFKMPVKEVIGKDRVPGFEIIHSVNLMLVNDAGRVVGKFDARKDEDMARLRRELKRIAKPSTIKDNAASESEKQ